MNCRSCGHVDLLGEQLLEVRVAGAPAGCSNTSAMATSLIGPLLVDSASAAAPVPRPPQPTRASWIVLFSAGVDVRNGHPRQGRRGGNAAGVLQEFTTRRDWLRGFVQGSFLWAEILDGMASAGIRSRQQAPLIMRQTARTSTAGRDACGQIFWRSGTGGIFVCKRPIFSLGRDAKMRPVPLLGGRRGRGAFSRHVLPRTQIFSAKKPPVPSDWSAGKSCRTRGRNSWRNRSGSVVTSAASCAC